MVMGENVKHFIVLGRFCIIIPSRQQSIRTCEIAPLKDSKGRLVIVFVAIFFGQFSN